MCLWKYCSETITSVAENENGNTNLLNGKIESTSNFIFEKHNITQCSVRYDPFLSFILQAFLYCIFTESVYTVHKIRFIETKFMQFSFTSGYVFLLFILSNAFGLCF